MGLAKRLDHLGIVVEDLAAARAFWEGALGVTCSHEEDMPERGIRVAFLPLPGCRIELIASTRPDGEVARFLTTRGPGLHHLCVETEDAAAALTDLKARGTRLVDEQPRPGAHGTRVGFIHPKATGGVLLEVAQLPPTAHKDH